MDERESVTNLEERTNVESVTNFKQQGEHIIFWLNILHVEHFQVRIVNHVAIRSSRLICSYNVMRTKCSKINDYINNALGSGVSKNKIYT